VPLVSSVSATLQIQTVAMAVLMAVSRAERTGRVSSFVDAAGSALEAEDGKLEEERKSMLARALPLNRVTMRGNVLKKYEHRLLAAQSPRKSSSPQPRQNSSTRPLELRPDGSGCANLPCTVGFWWHYLELRKYVSHNHARIL
jgi:hypothetical protein